MVVSVPTTTSWEKLGFVFYFKKIFHANLIANWTESSVIAYSSLFSPVRTIFESFQKKFFLCQKNWFESFDFLSNANNSSEQAFNRQKARFKQRTFGVTPLKLFSF